MRQLQAFSNAIHQTLVQHFIRLQLTACSRSPLAIVGFLLPFLRTASKLTYTVFNCHFQMHLLAGFLPNFLPPLVQKETFGENYSNFYRLHGLTVAQPTGTRGQSNLTKGYGMAPSPPQNCPFRWEIRNPT